MILILHKRRVMPVQLISQQNSELQSRACHAMKLLRENKYIVMNPDGAITLTKAGLEIAERMYDRHKMLAKFLCLFGVDEETAFNDACKIEHDISDKSFQPFAGILNRDKFFILTSTF